MPGRFSLFRSGLFFLIGYLKGGGKRFSFNNTFIYTIISYTALISILYILNQIADRKSDAINQKHLLIAEGLISLSYVYIELVLLMIITLIFLINLPLSIILFMFISFIFGIIYSFPPFKFKAIPIVDFLINGIGYGLVNFSIGWLTVNHFSNQTIISSLPYLFAVSAIFVNTTILDIEGDKKCGYLTTGVLLGNKKAARLGLILIIICLLISVSTKDYVCLIPALASSPLFLVAALNGDDKYVKLSIRIGGPLLILIVGILFPYFLALSFLIFIFLRIYYKKKFGITYPGL